MPQDLPCRGCAYCSVCRRRQYQVRADVSRTGRWSWNGLAVGAAVLLESGIIRGVVVVISNEIYLTI
jgi:hypothetical protein